VTRPLSDSDFSRDWDAVRAQSDIQFAPVETPAAQQSPPDVGWLVDFLNWLGKLFGPAGSFVASNWTAIAWVLGMLVAGLMLFALWRLLSPIRLLAGTEAGDGDDLVLDQAQARQLLADADRLAAEGRFDEATHLLLMRSVSQITQVRPDLIDPSSTAREIAALPALPSKARQAFSEIAERVERSLFALRRLSADDWHAARAAYADFALGYRGETA
jgi:hypothetical protein